MGVVTHRRTGTTKAGLTTIGLALYRPGRQSLARCGDLRRQTLSLSRNVEHHPVPPTAAGGRVGVIDGQGIALGACRGSVPLQGRGLVLPAAAKTVVDLVGGQRRAIGDLWAAQCEI